MKLSNFASLDPAITGTGRKGLEGASNLDREIWDEFHADWEALAVESELLRRKLDADAQPMDDAEEQLMPEDFTGETRKVVTEQRIKQSFFRRAVLSSYRGRCCMSGLTETRLLIASHIVPWSKDKANRLNPSNGLCLSAIHDRAFDKGLITLTDDFKVVVSAELKRNKEPFVKEVLLPLDGKPIELPERFTPQRRIHRMAPDGAFRRQQGEVIMKRGSTAYCVFEYLYRDGSNYKAWGSLLLSGEPTQEDITALKACLESGEYFVAEQVGVPPVYKELWDLSGGPTSDDHALHEFVAFRTANKEDAEKLADIRRIVDITQNISSCIKMGLFTVAEFRDAFLTKVLVAGGALDGRSRRFRRCSRYSKLN